MEAAVTEVGIRELKAQASKILDEVREHGARYVITRRGRPVGLLLPIEDVVPSTAGTRAVWQELERLGEEIGRGWTSSRTSGEILSELRR
jgi:prevent-host-death family protein